MKPRSPAIAAVARAARPREAGQRRLVPTEATIA